MKNNTLIARIFPIIILGFLTGLYLLHHHLEVKHGFAVGKSICNLNEVFDCDAVAKSKYSEISGIPVARLGAIYFFILLLATYFFKKEGKDSRAVLLLLSFLSIFPTALMLGISLVIVKKVCLFCAFLYLITFFLFGMLLYFSKNDGTLLERLKSGVYFLLRCVNTFNGRAFYLSSLATLTLFWFAQGLYVTYILQPRFADFLGEKVLNELIISWNTGPKYFERSDVEKIPGKISLGDPAAPIQIVELSDFECPFCHKVDPILSEIFEKNKEKVNLVLLNYPLDDKCNPAIKHKMHAFSCVLADMVISATLNDNTAGYNLHRRIMESRPETEADFKRLKTESGIEKADNAKIVESLSAQIDFGIKNEVHGTPAIFINGKKLVYNSFYQVDAVLKTIVKRFKLDSKD